MGVCPVALSDFMEQCFRRMASWACYYRLLGPSKATVRADSDLVFWKTEFPGTVGGVGFGGFRITS